MFCETNCFNENYSISLCVFPHKHTYTRIYVKHMNAYPTKDAYIHDSCRFVKRVWPLLTSSIHRSRQNDNGSWSKQEICNACCRRRKLNCFVKGLAGFVNSVLVARRFSCSMWDRSGSGRSFGTHSTSSS